MFLGHTFRRSLKSNLLVSSSNVSFSLDCTRYRRRIVSSGLASTRVKRSVMTSCFCKRWQNTENYHIAVKNPLSSRTILQYKPIDYGSVDLNSKSLSRRQVHTYWKTLGSNLFTKPVNPGENYSSRYPLILTTRQASATTKSSPRTKSKAKTKLKTKIKSDSKQKKPKQLSFVERALVHRMSHIGKSSSGWREIVMMLKQQEVIGIRPHLMLYNHAISECARAGEWRVAQTLLSSLSRRRKKPHVSLYETVIKACGRAGQWEEAMVIFRHLQNGEKPAGLDAYHAIMNACANSGNWEMVMYILDDINDRQIGPTTATTYTIAIKALALRGQWEVAEGILQQVTGLGEVQLNYRTTYWMLRAYAEGGQKEKLSQLLQNTLAEITSQKEAELKMVDDQGASLVSKEDSISRVDVQILLQTAILMCAVRGKQAKEATELMFELETKFKQKPLMSTLVYYALALCNGGATNQAMELLRKEKKNHSARSLQPLCVAVLTGQINDSLFDDAFDMYEMGFVRNRFRIDDVTLYSRFIIGYGVKNSSARWQMLNKLFDAIDEPEMVYIDSRNMQKVSNLDLRSFHSLLRNYHVQQRWEVAESVLQEIATQADSLEELQFNANVQNEHKAALWKWAVKMLELKKTMPSGPTVDVQGAILF
ncbi:hypothetical protein SARC_05729 [Sphaeroforma arctica JP610]|uniref:Pentacotripeptide-repeat region of PRORP domain-containing protein n=1 Tax=Sphaeroforma arctica JP610 TaxID=667725 RepID=A0A0L0FYS2_9EUKA|nr:hypothetical protein SARC_05729 [Sphaeroforma arctica JP610]KNC81980.1 hypothetical protein SARC_05729 [Sphaeroforma arctica JP610]|eukprot:XP_014155882.1 hypothetical protein SARC_05729 [Sphaeroforma arctica JP610]